METNAADHSTEHFSADASGNGPRPVQTPLRSSISSLFRNRGGANGFGGVDAHPPVAHGATDDSAGEMADGVSGSVINPNIQFLMGQPGARRGGLRTADSSAQSQSALDQQLEREIQAWATAPSPISADAFIDQLMARHGLTASELAQRFNLIQRHAFRTQEPGIGFENRRQLGISLTSRTQSALPAGSASSTTELSPPPAVQPEDEVVEPPMRYGEESVDQGWLDDRNEIIVGIDEDYAADLAAGRLDLPFDMEFFVLFDEDGNAIAAFDNEAEFRQAWLLVNSGKLDELAQHYGFENGEELLAAHPELYVMFGQPEGAGRLGPPPEGFAMAPPEELAGLDSFLDDDDGIEMIIAMDNEPIPEPTTAAERAQMNRLGRERYFQTIRYERALDRVTDDYMIRRQQAMGNIGGPGWIPLEQSGIDFWQNSNPGPGDSRRPRVPDGYIVAQNNRGEWMVFSEPEFSEWYGAQDTPFGRVFSARFGVAVMSYREIPTFKGESIGYWRPTFNDGQIVIERGEWINDGLRGVDLANLPRLHNADAVWFDPMAGWVTPEQNIKRKTKWYKKVLAVVVIGVMTWATGGLAAGLVQGTLMSAVVGGAAAGAMSTFLSAEMSGGSASFGDVLKGAFIGAVTAYLTFEFTNWSKGLNGTPENAASAGNAANAADTSATFQFRDLFGNASIKGLAAEMNGGDFEDGFKAGAIAFVANYVEGLGDNLNLDEMDKLERVFQTTIYRAVGTSIRVGDRDGNFAENFAGEYLTNLTIDKLDHELQLAKRERIEERLQERFVNDDGTAMWRNNEERVFLMIELGKDLDFTVENFRAEQQRRDTQNTDAQRPSSSFSYGTESRAGEFPLGVMTMPAESPGDAGGEVSGELPLEVTGGFTDAEQLLIDDLFLSRDRIAEALPEGIDFLPDRSVSTYDSYFATLDQLEALRLDTYRDTMADTPVTDADGGRDLYGELELQWQADLAGIGDDQMAADLQAVDRNARLNAESAVPVNLNEAQWQTNAEVSDVNALIQLRDNKFAELSQHENTASVRPDFEAVQQELVGEIVALEILIEEEAMDVEQSLDAEADIATLQVDNNRDAARQDYLIQRAGGDFGASTVMVRELALPGFQSMLANGGETVFGGSDAEVEAVLDASDPLAVSATLDQRLQELKQSGSDPDQELLIRQNQAYAALTERFADRSQAAASQGNEPVAAYYANLSLTTATAFGQNDQKLLAPVQNPQNVNEFDRQGEYIEWRMGIETSRLQRAEARGDSVTAGMATDSYTQLDILLTSNQNARATWQNEQVIPGLRRLAVETGNQQVPPQLISADKTGSVDIVSNPSDSSVPMQPEEAIYLGEDMQLLDFWATNRTGYPTPGDAFNPIVGVAPGDDGVTIMPVNGQDDVWTVVFDEGLSVDYRGNEISLDAIRVERNATGQYEVLYEVAGMPIVADFSDQDGALWEAGLARVESVNTERSYLQSMQGVSPIEVNAQLDELGLQPLPLLGETETPFSVFEFDGVVIDAEQDLLNAAHGLQQANLAVMNSPDDPSLRIEQRAAQLEYQQQYWHLLGEQQRVALSEIDSELGQLGPADQVRFDELTEIRAGYDEGLRFLIAQRGNAELGLLILRQGGNTVDGSRALAFNASPEAFAAPMIDNFYLDHSTAAVQINTRDDALGYVLTTLQLSPEKYDATPPDERESLDGLAEQIFETGGQGAQIQVLPVVYQSDTGIASTLVYSVTSADGEHHIVDVDGSRFSSEDDYRNNNRTMNAIGDVKSVMPLGGEVGYDNTGRLILSSGDARIEGPIEGLRREWKLDYVVTGAGIVALGLMTYGSSLPFTVPAWGASALGYGSLAYGAGTSTLNLVDAGLHGRSLSVTDAEARLNYLTLGASMLPVGARALFPAPGGNGYRMMVAASVAGGAASVESTYRIMTNWENMTAAEQRESIAQITLGFVPMMFSVPARGSSAAPDSLVSNAFVGTSGTIAAYFGGPLGTSLVMGAGWTIRGATNTAARYSDGQYSAIFTPRTKPETPDNLVDVVAPGVAAQTLFSTNAGPHALGGINEIQVVGGIGYSNTLLFVGDTLLGAGSYRLRHGFDRPEAAERVDTGINAVGFTATGAALFKPGLDRLGAGDWIGLPGFGIGAAAFAKGGVDFYQFFRQRIDSNGAVVDRFSLPPRLHNFTVGVGDFSVRAIQPMLFVAGVIQLSSGVPGFLNSEFVTQTAITEEDRLGIFGNTFPTDELMPFELRAGDNFVSAPPPFELTNTTVASLPGAQDEDFGAAGTLLPDFSLNADSPGIQRTGMHPPDSAGFVVVEPGDTLWGISEDNAGFLLTEDERSSFGTNTDAQTLDGLETLMLVNPQEGFDPSLIDGNPTLEPGDPDLIIPDTRLNIQAPPEPIDFPDPRVVLDQIED